MSALLMIRQKINGPTPGADFLRHYKDEGVYMDSFRKTSWLILIQ